MKSTIKSNTRLWLSRLMSVAVCSALFVACSDSDDKPPVEYMSPTFEDKEVSAGEVVRIEFEADNTWQLSSQSGWCEIPADKKTGQAGKFTVDIQVTDLGLAFINTDEAKIDFSLNRAVGDKYSTSFKIKRQPKEMTLVVKDATTKEEINGAFVITADDEGLYKRRVSITANYDWVVNVEGENMPKWVEFREGVKDGVLSGKADVESSFWIYTNVDAFQKEGMLDEILLAYKDDQEHGLKLNVKIDDLGDAFLVCDFGETHGFKASATADGKFLVGPEGNLTEVNELLFNVYSSRDDFELYLVQIDGTDAYSKGDWLTMQAYNDGRLPVVRSTPVDFSKKKLLAGVNAGPMRKGLLFCLPKVVADAVNPEDLIEDLGYGMVIAAGDYNKYFIANAEQGSGESFSMSLSTSELSTGTNHPGTSLVSLEELYGLSETELIQNFGTKNAYMLSVADNITADKFILVDLNGYSKEDYPNGVVFQQEGGNKSWLPTLMYYPDEFSSKMSVVFGIETNSDAERSVRITIYAAKPNEEPDTEKVIGFILLSQAAMPR